MKKVVMVGLDPKVVDFSDPAYAKFEKLDAGVLAAALERDLQTLVAAGYGATWSLWDKSSEAEAKFITALEQNTPDAVLIGAGVRLNPTLTPLFERLVNLVREHAPTARICFNSGPYDSPAAVERQFPAR